jgi:hypothetical protein
MDKFLPHDDELGRIINAAAVELYERLSKVDADLLGMPAHCLQYYKASHSQRLFFSIETSSHLLYEATSLTGKRITDLVLMDYGAGVGTLYLLAKMAGCRRVIYNDHLEEWRQSAEAIAKAVAIEIDHYIVGDIDDSLIALEKLGMHCDLITSRNVVEHIYDLKRFFEAIYRKQPRAIVFSSTTANNGNPASVIKHRLWHRKWEKVYRGKRLNIIRHAIPGISDNNASRLANATQGLALNDLQDAIRIYDQSGRLPDPTIMGSNTCDPHSGVWAEHLLSLPEYRRLIDEKHYEVLIKPGFWDTHYNSSIKNSVGRLLNRFIRKGMLGIQIAPFIYVIAKPRLQKRNE